MKFMVMFVPIFLAFMVGMYNLYWYYDPSVRRAVEIVDHNITTRAEKGFGKYAPNEEYSFLPSFFRDCFSSWNVTLFAQNGNLVFQENRRLLYKFTSPEFGSTGAHIGVGECTRSPRGTWVIVLNLVVLYVKWCGSQSLDAPVPDHLKHVCLPRAL